MVVELNAFVFCYYLICVIFASAIGSSEDKRNHDEDTGSSKKEDSFCL